MLNITAFHGEQSRKYMERVTDTQYYQVLNHVERFGKNIMQMAPDFPAWKNGIPSVMQQTQLAKQKAVTMTRELQLFAFGLMRREAPAHFTDAQVKLCYKQTYSHSVAFTNKAGHDTLNENGEPVYADWVLGTGLDRPEGWKLLPTICHGTMIKKTDEYSLFGEMQTEFEVMDAFDPITLTRTPQEYPHLFTTAINWYRYPLPYGIADHWPRLDGRDVFIPLLGNHTTKALIPSAWLRRMKSNERFPANPYWPQR